MDLPVSLVIPTFERPDKLRQLLESLAGADWRCQTIIVDDSSRMDLVPIVDDFRDEIEIEYIRNEKNRGPSFSRNAGIVAARHDLVAFTDDDCVVTKDWMMRMYEYIRDAPGNVAGVGGRTLSYRNSVVGRYCEYHKILDPWFHDGRCLYLVTANAIFKKEKIKDVGCFDENVRKAGGEDVGLCFKLVNKGYDLLYNPDAVLFHDFNPSIKAFRRMFFNYGMGCRQQHDSHFRSLETRSIGFGGTISSGDQE